jgi:epoxyqueuosine reductase
MSLTENIKAEARRLGFALVGVTTPDPPAHFDVFESWLDGGRHGEMGYLASGRSRERRADPRRILPECRSILVVGARYPAAGPPSEPPSPATRGKVASYAWGVDYHEVLPERLQALVHFIEGQAGGPVPNRWYTDTGPILERDLAQRAGLGWIGKNTCLINPEQGSYFLLAEILLGIELDPDPPFLADRCGSCTRCLEACPTRCILPDRTLDARRCISYLTIELKGALPIDLRPQMGEWIFGCDVCQQVCPWNARFAGPDADPAFVPRSGVPAPELAAELSLSPQTFNQKFKAGKQAQSPVTRARRRGYLRNVAVALGNSGNPAGLPALIRALDDPEPLVRGHAAWALGRLGGEEAGRALAEAARRETDEAALAEIEAALATLGEEIPGSGDPRRPVRLAAGSEDRG